MPNPTTAIFLNKTTPAAPSGQQNIAFASDNATPQQSVTASDPLFVGDTGSGGLAGNVPAPPAGAAAGGWLLLADGSWSKNIPRVIVGFGITSGVPATLVTPPGRLITRAAKVTKCRAIVNASDSTGLV